MISALVTSLTSSLFGNSNLPLVFEHLDIKFADELGRTVAMDMLSKFATEESRNDQAALLSKSMQKDFAPCDKKFAEAFAISFSSHFSKIIEIGIDAIKGEGDQ